MTIVDVRNGMAQSYVLISSAGVKFTGAAAANYNDSQRCGTDLAWTNRLGLAISMRNGENEELTQYGASNQSS